MKLALGVLAGVVSATAAFSAPLSLVDAAASASDFPLVANGRAAVIVTDKADAEVVRVAADMLAGDVARVTGVKPAVETAASAPRGPVVILGTLGKSALIADLVKRGQLDVRALAGTWESFVIQTVPAPYPGVPVALVIAGSDRRGTAYGAVTLSEAIGISPWVWWADVAPAHRANLVLSAGRCVEGPPSVKYRGIFLNDEDWGLEPWAAKTFEPEAGNIGPKTYAKICELLLRLKANTLWPAMHPCTKAFNAFPENRLVADRYGIVMGSSHCEPLLRNNVDEWNSQSRGEWNYQTNRDGVLKYWEERLKENGRFENLYTLGMRGVHDGAMPFKGTRAQKVSLMERILADQRGLLANFVNPNVAQTPQVFIPYKEVLSVYQTGLKVPDDVTLVWPDDNHGYMRRLSTPAEQKRGGGSGIYYHVSYWGAPEDYLWLCTTPPALIWEEMRKAYDHGARRLWLLNVGDIKPAEIDTEFFFRLAWNIDAWKEDAQPAFLAAWAHRTFGPEHASEIAAILDEYYRLNFATKPEHLLQAKFTTNYDEIGRRLARFQALVARTDALFEKMPAAQRDAFYELVVYPVRASALMNEKILADDPAAARKAYEGIQAETAFFNTKVAGGKWRGIMSANPRNRPVFRAPQAAAAREENALGTTHSTLPAAGAESGCAAFEAEKPTRASGGAGGVAWKVIPGLGRSGDSIALLPVTESVPAHAALEYDFTAPRSGPAQVLVYAIPTHAIHDGVKLRYAASIDGQPPQVVDLDTAEFSPEWSANVLRAAAIGSTTHPLTVGRHTLRIRPLDPGLVFDKVVLDFGGLQPTQLGPPPTKP
jgi:hypothetical protein